MSDDQDGSGKAAIVLAVIAAVGGWGTSIITNWPSLMGSEHSAEKKQVPVCENIEGQWRRSAGDLIIEYTQSDCIVAGRVLTDSGANSHQLRAVLSGKLGVGYTRRSVDGCTTILSGEYDVLSQNKIQIRATGSGCGLGDHEEDFVYSKIK